MRPIEIRIAWAAVLMLCLLLIQECRGQDSDARELQVARDAELLGEVTEEAEDLLPQTPDKCRIALNRATEYELRELGLFSSFQVFALIKYRSDYGPLYSAYELAYVDGFDDEIVALLLPCLSFTTSSPVSVSLLQETGRHELFVRVQRVIEPQEGYRGEDPYYRGSPLKLFTRYAFRAGDGLQVGLTAEKDAGEQLLRGDQPGFDYLSGHIHFAGRGIVRQVIAGDYHVFSGQGLVLWSGFALSGAADPGRVGRYGRGIAPHTGAEENRFLRGAAIRMARGGFFMIPFYSAKQIDANRIPGSRFTSSVTGGYHRSYGELKDKDAVLERCAGWSMGYRARAGGAVFSFMRYDYDATLIPSEEAYGRYRFHGRGGSAAGLAYDGKIGAGMAFGEVAISSTGGIATLHGFSLQPESRISLSLLCRSYGRGYHAPYANAFGRGTGNRNEEGIYAGLAVKPAPNWNLSFSSDLRRLPWLAYQVNGPSAGYDNRAAVVHRITRESAVELQFRRSGKAEGAGDRGTIRPVLQSRRTNLRIHARFPLSERLAYSVRCESVRLTSAARDERGYLVYQDMALKGGGGWPSASVRLTLFDIPSYDSRIYAYESDLLHVLSVPSHHYRGIRYYLNLSCRLKRGVHIWAKIVRTRYFNRDQAGSGYNATPGPRKTEVRIQARFRF